MPSMRLNRSATRKTWRLGWHVAVNHSSRADICGSVRQDRWTIVTREQDYRNVTALFENWRYNFLGANLLVFKLRRLGFSPIRYRQLPFWAWGLTWNFIQHLLLWKFRLRMRTMVELERIIWRTSKVFVFGNAYNVVLAASPWRPSTSVADEPSPPIAVRSSKGRVAAYDLFCDRVLRNG